MSMNTKQPSTSSFLHDEFIPEDLGNDDQGPEPRDDNDENSWNDDDEHSRIHADDMERDDTPFMTEDNLWEDQCDTGDY